MLFGLDFDEEIWIENGVLFKFGEFLFFSIKFDFFLILKEFRKIIMWCKREEEEVVVCGEWWFVVMVIDCLCLWICVIFIVILILVVLFLVLYLVML